MQPLRAIIFTDLDGTLLDHHDYRFDAALPALAEVRKRAIPLILTTSKTLAEVIPLNRQLDNPQPVIVENGGVMAFPPAHDYPFELTAHETDRDHAIVRFSPPYTQIREFIEQQRSNHTYELRGFGDMEIDEVVDATGLTIQAATLAKQRCCSEPFEWTDNDERLQVFIADANAAGLCVTRGGRFWHLMGDTSKAKALKAMRSLYTGAQQRAPITIALGDSENDREMLQNADIAVVMKRHDGSHIDCHGIQRTIRSAHAGPAGWNDSILKILAELDGAASTTRHD